MAIWQASRPTVIDLGVYERHSWIEGSNFLVSKGIEDLVEASDASWLLTLHSFVCSAHESLESSRFYSRLPFWVFTLESHFFIFLQLSHYALENSKFIPNRWVIYQDDFGWKSLKEKPLQSKYPCSIKMDFSGT